jgi:hypothetical protein
MLRPIPYESLVAEAEAWPVASAASFKACAIRLVETRIGCLEDETDRLAAALEARLRHLAGGLSLDILRQVRDLAWFDNVPRDADQGRRVRLDGYLLRLARRYLESHGDRLCLKHRDGIGVAECAGRWRWLSLKLPPDLLVAVVAAADRREEPPEPLGERVCLLTPVLARILEEREVAETHLHVGAAVGFPRLWTAIVAGLAHAPPLPEELDRAGPPPFGSGVECVRRLFEAGIARLMMASFLHHEGHSRRGGGFAAFWCERKDEPGIRRIARGLAWQGGWEEAYVELGRALASLGSPDGGSASLAGAAVPEIAGGDRRMRQLHASADARLVRLESLYRRLVMARRDAAGGASLDERDPLVAWLPAATGRALPETRFSARALRYLQERGGSDPCFERLFWQYQRVRCLVFRYIVEETGTAGLDWFGRHYQHISGLRKTLDATRYLSALEHEAADLRLAALEARTAPPATWHEVCLEVYRLAEQALEFQDRQRQQLVPGAGHPPPEVALIFHFIKSREQDLGPAPRAGAGHPRICRCGRWYYQQWQSACAVVGALRRVPEILLLLRGLDVANAELAIPTWATLPLFRLVIEASSRAAAKLAVCIPGWGVQRVRVTCHLGEEFVRLAQGLRRMHEPIEFGLLETGSRIGHGIALGIDPAAWAREVPTVPQTAQERLEDLLWELERYGRGDLTAAHGRVEFVRHEAVRLSRCIFDASPNLDDLLEVRRRLHHPAQMKLIGFPFVRRPHARAHGEDRAFELLWRYLTDADVYERGQDLVEVPATPDETAFLIAAQHWLRGLLGQLEITIESNPSSNLLVGSLEALEDHPAFRLLPLPSRRQPGDNPVMLSVSTDDPVTFASHLADEYAHIYFAMTRRKVASEEALAWLDQVRRHGWRSRFSLCASSKKENLERVCKALQPLAGARPARRLRRTAASQWHPAISP